MGMTQMLSFLLVNFAKIATSENKALTKTHDLCTIDPVLGRSHMGYMPRIR